MIRIVAVSAVFVWSLYVTSMFRSWGAGAAFDATLLAAAVFAGPGALVALAGLPWRRQLGAILLLLVSSAALAEASAAVEEAMLVRRGERLPADAPVVFQSRWWPHGGSYLFYDPSTGRLGGGD